MRSVGVQDGSEYAKLLESDSNEPSLLFNSFSINVTEFYRDVFVWQRLSSQLVPQILQTNGKLPIKVWSAGCASGEESYGLGILLKEAIGLKNIKFDVIATDINVEALQIAKAGQYVSSSLKNLSPNIIAKYFLKVDDDKYEVSDEIKKHVSFEQEDILSSQINSANLIACRNLLIYYDKPAQDLIFNKFHKILTKNGYLVIGQDETMMGIGASKLFSCIFPRERIYRRV
jgi:chemotaxis protein methyltransferase CheR